MRWCSLVFPLFSLVSVCLAADVRETRLCPTLAVRSPEKLAFDDVETRMLCGVPGNGPWSQVPKNQIIYNFKNFLQDRGFFFPTFQQVGTVLVADSGPPTDVIGFEVLNAPTDIDFTRLRKIIGQRLTPKLLDTINERVEHFLQVNGYACPKIEMSANPKTGVITASVQAGRKKPVLSIDYEAVEGFDIDQLKRYRAFHVGDLYNPDFLQVTANRILDDNVLQSTHFSTRCEDDGVRLLERSVPGPPRVVAIGIGVDTEEIAILRASWKNSRLWSYGSQVSLAASASFLQQSFTLQGKWYYLPGLERHYLRPSAEIRHRNLQDVETLTANAGLAPAISFDTQNTGFTLFGGPNILVTRTIRGKGPGVNAQLTAAGELRITDHYFEYYRTAPRTGYQIRFETLLTQNNVLSNFSAYRFGVYAEKLWNLRSYEPPFLVLGLRGGFATTLTDETVLSDKLTPPFRHLLGGSQDLRGFGRGELSVNGAGALTQAFLSAEARFVDLLPWGIQPFLFADLGKLGIEKLALQDPLYVSPGLGIRLQTQIGVIRTTLSHGYLYKRPEYTLRPGNPEHLQFYFSFGEEF